MVRSAAAQVHIGTAGWSLRSKHRELFPGEDRHLERYGRIFNAAEINTTFYRPHRPATYEKWAASVPARFRFAVKLPKEITHERRLVGSARPLRQFLREISSLGDRLGPLLVQLPPSFAFERKPADAFLARLRSSFAGDVVIEPRHKSWFDDEVDALLAGYRAARAAADPALSARAARPGGWSGLAYWRLHGSPRIYSSTYDDDYIAALARRLKRRSGPVWCIFDNTLGDATLNALRLKQLIGGRT